MKPDNDIGVVFAGQLLRFEHEVSRTETNVFGHDFGVETLLLLLGLIESQFHAVRRVSSQRRVQGGFRDHQDGFRLERRIGLTRAKQKVVD